MSLMKGFYSPLLRRKARVPGTSAPDLTDDPAGYPHSCSLGGPVRIHYRHCLLK